MHYNGDLQIASECYIRSTYNILTVASLWKYNMDAAYT